MSAPVIKTLIIGLGSTGTRIANEVARRLEWELGSVDRAPWVRFLCIETNAGEPSPFHESGDFISIGLSAAEYGQILENPSAFDEQIELTKWAHMETLRKLPGHDVSGGAGNIRMVGRLVFLHQSNYNRVKRAVSERLDSLRTLLENGAKEARGPLADGSNPDVEFGAGGQVRILLAGTLCGGTCSGIAADFGFFLQPILRTGEKTIAVFTLPRPDMSPAIRASSEFHKTNAYHALIELNHHHLSGRPGEPETGAAPPNGVTRQTVDYIKFPDCMVSTDRFPYDLPYLAMPNTATGSAEQELNRAIADRFLMNILCAQTDPFARAVDATVIDRKHRAHVFCAFGLSTVEYPVQQIVEACSRRLLAHTLSNWQGRTLQSHEYETRLSQLGLTWDGVVDLLRQLPDGENLRQRYRQKRDEIGRLALVSAEEAERALGELRRAFTGVYSGEAAGALQSGLVPHLFQSNRRSAAEGVVSRLRAIAHAHLVNYHDGPAPLQQLLQKANERLAALQEVPAPTEGADAEAVDGLLKPLRAYHHSLLLGFFGLRKPAIERLRPKIELAIEEEIRAREAVEAFRALHSRTINHRQERGTLEYIRVLLSPAQQRIDSLRKRVVALANSLQGRSDELARATPQLNGLCIFEAETGAGGTVKQDFETCLQEHCGDLARDWREIREEVAESVIRTWTSLPDAIAPATAGTTREDWLLRAFDPLQPDGAIPEADLKSLEEAAKQPFLRLSQVDVLDRWHNRVGQQVTPALEAREAASKSRSFLDVSAPLAERGGRSPIYRHQTLLVPESPFKESFVQAVTAAFTGKPTVGPSPDRFRAVMLEEWFRFPLSGAPSLLGSSGLHSARCSNVPEFHTRVDVHWTGLSDFEVETLVTAEELVTLSVLLGVLQPRQGYLELPWARSGPSDPGVRRLSLDVRSAARLVALQRRDESRLPNGQVGLSLEGVQRLLRDSIERLRRSAKDEQGDGDLAFIRLLERRLQEGVAGIRNWDVASADEHIQRFCAHDDRLFSAFQQQYPPDQSVIAGLWRNQGDAMPQGGIFKERGLYCPECGGLFGLEEKEAAENGWRCYVNPAHVAFPRGQ